MSRGLAIVGAGPGVTVQDSGRRGFLRYGVTAAGPMDALAYALANRAADAPESAAALEVSLGGIEATADGGALTVAVAGGAFAVTLDGRPLPSAVVLTLEPGMILRIRPGAAGAWCYLAVGGGFDVAPVLGSAATHTRSGIGGVEGRSLRAGDRLAVRGSSGAGRAPAAIVAPWLDRPAGVVRVALGPQADYFADDQIAAFLNGSWTVSPRSDRMAIGLDGPTITHLRGADIVSDGVVMGAIQIPGDGRPLVLMADRQPTGGYPKIATVIGADLGRLAQARAGTTLRFEAVTVEDAVAARRDQAARLSDALRLEPVLRSELSSEFLLGLNLIDGVVGDGA